MAAGILSAKTMNFDGQRSPLRLRNVTTYVLATAGAKIAKKGQTSKRGPGSTLGLFFYCRTLTTVIENGPYLQHARGRHQCCSESIRFSAITVCTVGHRFGYGWAVVITSTREVKSASSRGSKNQMYYLPIDAFSILLTKTHHTSGAFYADHVSCSQIVRILDCNLNKTIAQIGSLDISRLL